MIHFYRVYLLRCLNRAAVAQEVYPVDGVIQRPVSRLNMYCTMSSGSCPSWSSSGHVKQTQVPVPVRLQPSSWMLSIDVYCVIK